MAVFVGEGGGGVMISGWKFKCGRGGGEYLGGRLSGEGAGQDDIWVAA